MLLDRKRRRFAGRPADDETVGAIGCEMVEQLNEAGFVNIPLLIEGRDDRSDDRR